MPNRPSTGEDRAGAAQAADGQQQDRQRAERLEEDGQRHDQPAPEAVGGGARHQHQQQRRQELDDADEAEIERIAGEVVDLPADRDRDDLGRKGRQEPRRPEAQESAMAEGSVALVDGVSGHGRIPGTFGGDALVGAGLSYLAQLASKRMISRSWTNIFGFRGPRRP